jgi:folate-binding protein YgfZ
VADLSPVNPLFGAWLTPKGRALSLMHLLDVGDGTMRLLLPAELAEDVAKRLRMFVLRDDVTFTLEPDEAVLGLVGDSIDQAGRDGQGVSLAHLSSAEPPLALCLVSATDANAFISSLQAAGHSELSQSTWDLLQIRAGLPRVVEATRDAFVPQMINLDLLGAISFSKGCYPGQEIVARTQHLGRIKRRTFIGHCDAASPYASPGDTLVTEDGGDAAGRIVLSAPHDGGQEMLAVLSLAAVASSDTFRLNDSEGPRVKVVAPSYLTNALAS